jgi:hypothetical protein
MAWLSRGTTAGPDTAGGSRYVPTAGGSRSVARKGARPIAMDAASAATAVRAVLSTRCPDESSVLSFEDAIGLICQATGWPVGHAWVSTPSGWRTSGAWYDSGSPGVEGSDPYAGLRDCTAVTELGSGRGIVAAVLHLASCRFLPGLEGLGSTVRHREATEAGLSAVVGVPVRTQGKIFTVLEFVTLGYVEPDDALAEALLDVASRARCASTLPTPITVLPETARHDSGYPEHLAV